MKARKIDSVEVCKEFEDILAPRLRLTVIDRSVYYHLLRHTRLEGKLRLRFTVLGIGANLGLSRARCEVRCGGLAIMDCCGSSNAPTAAL